MSKSLEESPLKNIFLMAALNFLNDSLISSASTSNSKTFSVSKTFIGVLVSCPLKIKSRSEEHTSELQSRGHLVCRLLLEKKKSKQKRIINDYDSCGKEKHLNNHIS